MGGFYRGTHAQGGAVCFTVSADFSAILSFHAFDVQGSTCSFDKQIRFGPQGLPISGAVDRRATLHR